MSMEVDFAEPYLESIAAPPGPLQTPQFMEVSIAGRPYVLDTSFEPYRRDAFRHRSIQSQRESISLDNIPGAGTVNTEGLWRREAWDWHFGAGQPYQDRKDSVDARFSTSKGVNPWMQWQLELLNDTEKITSFAGNAQVAQVGPYIYILDIVAQTLTWTLDLVHFDEVAGLSGFMPMMATDGYNLWIASTVGIFATTPGGTLVEAYIASTGPRTDTVSFTSSSATIDDATITAADAMAAVSGTNIPSNTYVGWGVNSPVPGTSFTLVSITNAPVLPTGSGTSVTITAIDAFDGIYWAGDNLMATYQNSVFQITQAGPKPAALWTHPNPGFVFSAMCSGSSQLYIAGYVAGGGNPLQSTVYRTTIEATGTALTIPVQALPMEGGEYATSLYGYLNYIFVGSNLGVRMCRTIAAYDPTGNEGDLEAGPLLPGLFPPGPVNSPVFAMLGNNRFVYFGWNNYDNVSTGLGRCDLSTFIDTQAPAFASDLMVTGSGNVTSMDWCTINNQPIFVVEGLGLYTSTGSPVESGYVTSGSIGYGIMDDKIVLAGDIGTVSPQQGNVSMSLASDAASNILAFVGQQVSTSSGGTPNQSVFAINAIRGEQFVTQLQLTRDPMTSVSPIVHRWTLKAIPAITAGTTVSVVIRMWTVEDIAGQDYYFDPYVEKAFLENLRTTQSVFAYEEGPLTYPYCTVDEIDWLPEKRWDAHVYGGFQGDIIVYIKTYDLGA